MMILFPSTKLGLAHSADGCAEMRHRIGGLGRAAVMLGLAVVCLPSHSSIVITYPVGSNYIGTALNSTGDYRITLSPDPIKNANEFFGLSKPSAAVEAELKDKTDTDYTTWNFDYAAKWGTLAGTLSIDEYQAAWKTPILGGGLISMRYNRAATDPATSALFLLQMVTTTDPICTSQTGRPCGGVLPIGPYIDPFRNDDPLPENDPFYYNSGEYAAHRSGSNEFGSFDLNFFDWSTRYTSAFGVNWQAELYLVEADLATKKGYFLDGIHWGWQGVPEPGSLWLAMVALLAAMGIRAGGPRRSRGCLAS